MNRHINVLDFTLHALARRKFKNIGIIAAFTFIVFILGSVLFLSYSFKREALIILKDAPQLIVQRTAAGRHELIPLGMSSRIEKIPGVEKVEPRYWGYYYDPLVKANYTVIAVPKSSDSQIPLLKGALPDSNDAAHAAIGRGVARARFIDLDSEISLQATDGKPADFQISGIFESESELLTADLIIIGLPSFRRLFGMSDGMATDLVVHVSNETEAPVIARKIRDQFPDTRPILRSEIIRTYEALFSWRSGLVLTLFAGALIAFLMLAWDKATGLSAEERKEIGILKAIGWETSDILEMKFWEGCVISLSAFLSGVILAYVHVFFAGASLFGPILKGWSVIYPSFRLVPYVNLYQMAVLMTVTVVPYIASTIIPSWKAAITEPDEVVRG